MTVKFQKENHVTFPAFLRIRITREFVTFVEHQIVYAKRKLFIVVAIKRKYYVDILTRYNDIRGRSYDLIILILIIIIIIILLITLIIIFL